MHFRSKHVALASSVLALACAPAIAEVEVVLSSLETSSTSSLPPIAGSPLSGSILVNGNSLAKLTLSPDGSQWVIGVLTTRGDASTTATGTPASPDYAIIRGEGLTPLATVIRSGIPATYSAFGGSTELDISTTSQSLYRPSILNNGTVGLRTLTSEGTATRGYALSIAPDGTTTVMSKLGDTPPTLPSGATDLTIGNIPGTFTSYNDGFVYYTNLNRGATVNASRAILDYNTSSSTLTALTNNGAAIGSTGSTVYQPLDGSFGVSGDGADFLYVTDRTSNNSTRAVVVNDEIVIADGTPFGGDTVLGGQDIKAKIGTDGTYLATGFLNAPTVNERKSFLALGTPGGSVNIVARSRDLIADSPVANERIAGAVDVGITVTNQNKLNNNFALDDDGEYAFVADTAIDEDLSFPAGSFEVLRRSVLLHGTHGYLIGIGDEVDLPDGFGTQPYYLSNFVADTLSINDDYAYITAFLRPSVTYNTTGTTYASFSGDSVYAVLAIPIPEPTTLGLLAFAGGALLRRRR